ncbi:MAG: hypothetical protein HYV09_11880 [Deltaproteobacteria bacterium]|nr:hypothetical protein [Deltaproteobacteria bacterium]
MIRLLHEDAWFRVEHNPSDAVFRAARSGAPFPDPQTADRAFSALDAALTTVPRGARLLLDLRDWAPRDDEELEAMVERVRDRVFARFERVAVLVRAAVGKRHVQRRIEGQPAAAIFDDEDRAMDHLLA